jgi:hypothetical protein
LRQDFVKVRLTDYAAALGPEVTVGGGRQNFTFKPGEVQEVTRAFDWERVLKSVMIDGHEVFEIAE